MSQEKIEQMISEITNQYQEQLDEYLKSIADIPDSAGINYTAQRRIRQIQREMHTTIIREVGNYIIKPYTDEPYKVIAQFIHERDSKYFKHEYKTPYPQLNEFMEWFCDSAIIKEEVESERKLKRRKPVLD